MLCRATLSLLLLSFASPAERRVAITIDDLPVAQSGRNACEFSRLQYLTKRLLEPFRAGRVPLTGFVVAGNCAALSTEQKRSVLRLWTGAGAELGNHTYSHPGLNTTPIEEYERDILRAAAALKQLLGTDRIRYFRSPMLHTGTNRATKERLERFLAEHGYQQAPVTFDNSDWMFAYVYADARSRQDAKLAGRVRDAYVSYMESIVEFFEKRAVEVVGRDIAEIQLIHANRLNAEMAPRLLAMLKRRGYRFVSLEEALRDDAYRLPNEYAGKGGFSWIHRWSMTKGMPNQGEPDEPAWLRREYEKTTAREKK
ncbi:MAG: polysaccharide deacetylase family protein [Acidobacteria bacterium]|nr:polysaccharide deacetylase family protein [Acidobacteriota bacterium]